MLNGLDLFSGIGGMSIALQEWIRPIAYCEIEPYCQGVLLSRMSANEIGCAPIWDDIRTFNGKGIQGNVDIIYGGFTCQDISVAGHGKGLAGERNGLFFEIVRLAKEIKPIFIFLENVPAITNRGGLQVVREITELGYDCRSDIISAKSVGAKHKRRRWFLLARSNSKSERGLPIGKKEEIASIIKCNKNVADSRFECQRCLQKSGEEDWTSFHDPRCSRFLETEPNVGRVADGVPQRVDRIRALGNAVVPQQAKEAFKILMGLK